MAKDRTIVQNVSTEEPTQTPLPIPLLMNAGTSEGAEKGWDKRGRGQKGGDESHAGSMWDKSKGGGEGKVSGLVSLDWKDLGDDDFAHLKEGLEDVGVSVKEDKRFNGSDQWGFTFEASGKSSPGSSRTVVLPADSVSAEAVSQIKSAAKGVGLSVREDSRYKGSDSYGLVFERKAKK